MAIRSKKKIKVKKKTFKSGEARNIKLGQQVNVNQRLLLSSPSQKVVSYITTSQPHDSDKFFSLVTEGLLLSDLCSKNNSLIEVHRALPIGVSNVIAFWSRDRHRLLVWNILWQWNPTNVAIQMLSWKLTCLQALVFVHETS